jgi:hypothetical protein
LAENNNLPQQAREPPTTEEGTTVELNGSDPYENFTTTSSGHAQLLIKKIYETFDHDVIQFIISIT